MVSAPLIAIKNLYKSYGEHEILRNISLSIHHGEFLTLLGPSGCGKTTLLRLISGFETPCEGVIEINQRVINHLPPQQRNVHTIFQSYALFPHMDVFENVAFPLRCQKMGEDEIQFKVKNALTLVQLPHLSHREISRLSGGQQQRVAIARAIVNQPEVLLLDEPLSSLDYRLRKSMQMELKQLQKTLNMTFLFVTHDQEEALSMSDRIVVFNHGEIEQIGTPRNVYETPVNLHVAKFIGEANIFDLTVEKVSGKHLQTTAESVALTCLNSRNLKPRDRFHLVIRPEDIRVWGTDEVEDISDMIPGHIIDITYKGSTVDLKVKLPSGKIINATEFFDEDDANLEYKINESVWIHWLTGWEVLLPHED